MATISAREEATVAVQAKAEGRATGLRGFHDRMVEKMKGGR